MEVSASWNRITAIRRRVARWIFVSSRFLLSISSFLARCRKRVASSASPRSAAKAARWRHTPICSSRAAALMWRRVPYPMSLKKEIASRRPPAISVAAGGASVQPPNPSEPRLVLTQPVIEAHALAVLLGAGVHHLEFFKQSGQLFVQSQSA